MITINKPLVSYVFLVTFMLLMFSACAEQPTKPEVSEDSQKIIVFPVFSIVKEFHQYNDEVHGRLIAELQKLGFDVVTVSEEQYRDIRHHALEQSGSIYNPAVGDFVPYNEQVYVADIVLQLAKSVNFDLLLMPELTLRTATVDGDLLVWDGVRLPQVIKGKKNKTYRVPDKARGLSLKIALYTRAGREQVKHYTGVAVPYYLDLERRPPSYRLREQLFDDGQLDASIELALKTLKVRLK